MKKIMKINLMVSVGLLIVLGIWLAFKSSNTEIGHIEPVGHYCYPISVHKTLLLKNGDVFIYGHFKDRYVAQLYHPKSRTFECLTKPAVVNPREGINMALLASGDVLISGGNVDTRSNDKKRTAITQPLAVASAQVSHYKTKTFERVSDMTIPRAMHRSVLLQDGRLLILGGDGFDEYAPLKIDRIKELIYKSAELYDEKTKKFLAINAHMSRGNLTFGTQLSANKVLIHERGALELFDPKHQSFITLQPNLQQQIGFEFYRLDNDSAVTFPKSEYIGLPPQIYNVSENKFIPIPIRMPHDIIYGTTSRLSQNHFLFTGGLGQDGIFSYDSDATYLVDIQHKTVKQGPRMPFKSHFTNATVLSNGNVLLTPNYNPRHPAQQPCLLILNKKEIDNEF